MPRMPSQPPTLEIACQQMMSEDASIFSVQWADLPATVAGSISARELLGRYLRHIRRCTLTLVRPVTLESGIEFRLFRTPLSLISFLPPEHKDGFATLRIRGGFLVQPGRCDRGELRFGVEPAEGSVRVSLRLTDFCPAILGSGSPSPLRFWLYRVTQAAVHRLVTVRFLSLLHRELAATSAGVRVVNVVVRSGRAV